MTRHLLKLIWNRRRTNALVVAEILLSFLAVFGVVALGVYHLDNYRRPLGFDIEDVWLVEYDTKGGDPAFPDRNREIFWKLVRTMRELPPVEAVASHSWGLPPYHPAGVADAHLERNGRSYATEFSQVTDDYLRIARLDVTRGRWFSREDDVLAPDDNAIVVNERMARDMFGDEDPLGQRLAKPRRNDGTLPPGEFRVVGVVREYRPRGEMGPPGNHLFARAREEQRTGDGIVVRMRAGTPVTFQEQLVARLFQEAPRWSFRVRTLAEWRSESRRAQMTPLVALGLIIGFLLLMVVLGLMGVLWQNVTQRTQELGLRRAKGATAARIHRQIQGEAALMTTFAVVVGAVLLVQLPLLDQLQWVGAGVFAVSLVLSAAAIYVVTAVCAFYPARLATRVQPAEALHYE
jgi:putative ABC transport system permease protein